VIRVAPFPAVLGAMFAQLFADHGEIEQRAAV
jgi:hypothetical protein